MTLDDRRQLVDAAWRRYQQNQIQTSGMSDAVLHAARINGQVSLEFVELVLGPAHADVLETRMQWLEAMDLEVTV